MYSGFNSAWNTRALASLPVWPIRYLVVRRCRHQVRPLVVFVVYRFFRYRTRIKLKCITRNSMFVMMTILYHSLLCNRRRLIMFVDGAPCLCSSNSRTSEIFAEKKSRNRVRWGNSDQLFNLVWVIPMIQRK
jgi:hypothetical protein